MTRAHNDTTCDALSRRGQTDQMARAHWHESTKVSPQRRQSKASGVRNNSCLCKVVVLRAAYPLRNPREFPVTESNLRMECRDQNTPFSCSRSLRALPEKRAALPVTEVKSGAVPPGVSTRNRTTTAARFQMFEPANTKHHQ